MHHCKKNDYFLKKLIPNPLFLGGVFLSIFTLNCSVMAMDDLGTVPLFVQTFLKERDLSIGKTYQNSFEKVDDFKGHYIVPPKHKNSSSHQLERLNAVDGMAVHKAWMYGSNYDVEGENTNHRAYPTLQMKKTSLGVIETTVLVDLYVWVDIDLSEQSGKNWLSLATFTSYYDPKWWRTYLVNVDSDYHVHLMHVPEQGVSYPDIYQSKELTLPKKQWVRITTLIDYSRQNRFDSPIIAVWQDGELASASRFNDRINPYKLPSSQYPECLEEWDKQELKKAEELCGLHYLGGLAQMHFGLYAPPGLTSGVIYNDHLVVSELIRGRQ